MQVLQMSCDVIMHVMSCDVMQCHVMAASSPMCVNAGAADVASKAGDAKDSLQEAANSAGLE